MGEIRGEDLLGTLGTLNTGTAVAALPRDHSPVSFNVEDTIQGAIRSRNGRTEQLRLAAHPPVNWAWGYDTETSPAPLIVTHGAGGGLDVGDHEWRASYVTSAGETDTRFARVITSTASAGDYALVKVRFHLKAQRAAQYVEADGEFKLTLQADGFLAGFADDAYVGFEVYSRDPVIQDETHLGSNQLNEPLYNRASPLAVVTGYDSATRTFFLDRSIPNATRLDWLDILMPDRGGLAIRAVKVYCRAPGDTVFREAATIFGPQEVRVDAIDPAAAEDPETRVDRTAPTCTEVRVKDIDPNVKGRRVFTSTNIVGGVLLFRSCWRSRSPDLIMTPGYTPRPRRSPVELFPSAAALVAVRDGYGVAIELPDSPEGVDDAVIYGRRLEPVGETTFEGITNPAGAASRAYYYDPTSLIIRTIALLTPAEFRSVGRVFEYSTSNYAAIAAADDNTVIRTKPFNKDQHELVLTGPQIADTTQVVLVVAVRALRGQTYTTARNTSLMVRYWDEGLADWTVLADNIRVADDWQYLRLGFAWAASYLESGRFVVDVVGGEGIGLELDDVHLERYEDPAADQAYYDDIIPTSDELYQDEGLDVVTLQTPLNESLGAIMPNTSGQWPTDVWDWPIPDRDTGVEPSRRLVAALDCLFVDTGSGLQRFWQEEGDEDPATHLPTLRIGLNDWQAATYEDRAFFCNPEHKLTNIAFDLVAARRMGLKEPPLGQPGQIRILEIAGEVDGDYEWLAIYERDVIRAAGFGYTVRSAAASIGQVREADNATVQILVPASPDPAATHVAVYRPLTGGSTFYRVGRSEIRDVPLGGLIRFVDNLPDDALAVVLKRETGQPPAAVHICEFQSRVYLTPQGAPGQVWPSNIAGASGSPDPEGMSPKNAMVPQMPTAAPITALAPYATGVVVHSLPAPGILTPASSTLDGPSAHTFRQAFGGGGAVGPKACVKVGLDQAFINPEGPAILRGDEVKPLQGLITGTWERATKDSETFRFMRAWFHRTDAKSQLCFTFAGGEDGFIDRVLVLDVPDEGPSPESAKWREWRDFPAHGVVVTRDAIGIERVLVGDQYGRIHWTDHGRTDNGRFISWRHETKDHDLEEKGHSDALRFLSLWFREQGVGIPLLVDILPDYDDVPRGAFPYRPDMGGRGVYRWLDPGFLWDDDGVLWGEEHARRYAKIRFSVGGTYSRSRFAFHQAWDQWPVGAPREADVELAGFMLESYDRGYRATLKQR